MMNFAIRLIITLFVAALLISCSKTPQELIVGEWKGVDDKDRSVSFIFNEDDSAEMIMGDRVINKDTVGGEFSWYIDDTYSPIHLDFIITKPPKEPKTMQMIIEFTSNNKIRIGMSDKLVSRPPDFSQVEKNKLVNLVKQ
jgi:hypothetical protein